MIRQRTLAAFLAALLAPASVSAGAEGQRLYPFSNVTLRDTWSPSRWSADTPANVLELRTTVPFQLWGVRNFARVVVPYRTDFPGGAGLGDVHVFDLIAFKQSWGIWAIGPAVNLRARTSPAIDTFQLGPAAALAIPRGPFLFGVINQNIFSDQVAASTLQPIFEYRFLEYGLVGLGELPIVYDWRGGRFLAVPIGLEIGGVIPAREQEIQLSVNPQFNLAQVAGSPQWTIAWNVTFLIPPRLEVGVSAGGEKK